MIHIISSVGNDLDFKWDQRVFINTYKKCYHVKHFSLVLPCGRNDLSATPVYWLVSDDRVQDLELGISDRLLTKGSFSGAPLEALHD